jgi:sugar O-acyltransferase (sialic acid O-acetyltransferase NeuD family)
VAKPTYLLGAGGHASVLVDMLKENGIDISFICSPDIDSSRKVLADIPILNDENVLLHKNTAELVLVNGIGSLPCDTLRNKIFNKFSEQGFLFKQVISKHAVVSLFATLGHGVQVMPGAIVQAGAIIGDNTIINTGAIIEHDCVIGKHNHIAPGVTLSGHVSTGNNVHIGSGATIIQNISIGTGTVIAAGAIVTKHIESEKIVFGSRANIQDKKVK